MNNILVIENVMTAEENKDFYQTAYDCGYRYGEADNAMFPPTGLVNELNASDVIYAKTVDLVRKNVPFLVGSNPYRAYVNLFLPTDRPYFHVDGSGTTVLVYATKTFELQEGGETQFVNNFGHIVGVLPKPSRMVVFDASIMHRATSYRTLPRFTVALKYETVFSQD